MNPQTQTIWTKTCPACGHKAYEHTGRESNAGDVISISDPTYRYCQHAVPIKGKPDAFTFCGCKLKSEDTARAGNIRLIKASAKVVS